MSIILVPTGAEQRLILTDIGYLLIRKPLRENASCVIYIITVIMMI